MSYLLLKRRNLVNFQKTKFIHLFFAIPILMFSGLETCYCASAGDKESHEKESLSTYWECRYAALADAGVDLTSWCEKNIPLPQTQSLDIYRKKCEEAGKPLKLFIGGGHITAECQVANTIFSRDGKYPLRHSIDGYRHHAHEGFFTVSDNKELNPDLLCEMTLENLKAILNPCDWDTIIDTDETFITLFNVINACNDSVTQHNADDDPEAFEQERRDIQKRITDAEYHSPEFMALIQSSIKSGGAAALTMGMMHPGTYQEHKLGLNLSADGYIRCWNIDISAYSQVTLIPSIERILAFELLIPLKGDDCLPIWYGNLFGHHGEIPGRASSEDLSAEAKFIRKARSATTGWNMHASIRNHPGMTPSLIYLARGGFFNYRHLILTKKG